MHAWREKTQGSPSWQSSSEAIVPCRALLKGYLNDCPRPADHLRIHPAARPPLGGKSVRKPLVRQADTADKWPYSRYDKDLNRTLTKLMNTLNG